MASLMPSAKYAMFEQKTPLLSRLPDAYRSPKSWKGHTPEELLARACTPGLVTDGPSYTSKVRSLHTHCPSSGLLEQSLRLQISCFVYLRYWG